MSEEIDGIWHWGEDNNVLDAEVIVESWLGDNHMVPFEGAQFELKPEHLTELLRCQNSIEYFAENYFTITTFGVNKELIKLWPIQRQALRHFQENNRVVLNSSRQTSKTTLMTLFVLWNLLFGKGIQSIGLLGNNYTLAKNNLSKIKEAYEYLPLFLKPAVARWNESILEFDNKNKVTISSTTEAAFRGSTITSIVADEWAFVNNNGKVGLDETILQSVLPTLDAMAYNPEGDNSFCILISTPYGMNNHFAKIYHQARDYEKNKDPNKATKFKAFQMLWSDHPERDDKWYAEKIIEMGSEHAFYTEYGGSFAMGDDIKRVISADTKAHFSENTVKPPIFTQGKMMNNDGDPDDDSLKIWEYPVNGHIYIAGVDVAEGVGDCFSVIQIIDVTDLKDIRQVAEYRNNTISLQEFPLIVLKMANTYNQCWCAIENNNCGREVVSAMNISYGYRKLVRFHFNTTSNKRMMANNEFGIVAHNNSKNMSVANLYHFMNKVSVLTIRSSQLVTEMDGFVKVTSANNNWKWGKQGGTESYDDLVDALAWAMLLLHHKLVEDYFYLSDPKFDQYSKPIGIIGETIDSDVRATQEQMPINSTAYTPCIYTRDMVDYGGYESPEDLQADIEWLLAL